MRHVTHVKPPSSTDAAPGMVVRAVEEQLAALRNPPVDLATLLDTLRGLGLVQSLARLRELSTETGTTSQPMKRDPSRMVSSPAA